jgi:signal transduction histidine kinase
VSDVVEELQPVFDMMAKWSSVRFQVDVPPGLPEVSVDRLRVQHVLFSLFQNALDASVADSPEPAVTLSARADRYAVEVSVIDSGTGIPAEVTKQIFHPFFTTKPRGTGLGLASCRAIIEAHEGTIGFERAAEGGTRFWFRLPIMEK